MTRIRFRRANHSNGVTALKEELVRRGHNCQLIRMENSTFRQRPGDLVINWGDTGQQGLNHPQAVRRACNKVACLDRISTRNVPCPDHTINKEEAIDWIKEGSSVVCRTLTRGSSGAGIVMADTEEEIVDAPLYTRYIKKSQEYRVHVFNNKVIDIQRKARNTAIQDDMINWRIRTHDNGFVFVRENVELPDEALQIAREAVQHTGLMFGAVDLIYNEHYNQYYVLEINTAPGLEGQTIHSYANAIEKYIGER